MLAQPEDSVADYRSARLLRDVVMCILFVILTWGGAALALLAGSTGFVVLLTGVVAAAAVVFIFRRPVVGLAACLLLNLSMDPLVPGDTLSQYTDFYHLDLNTFMHPGIAFNPGELLLVVTTLAYLLRASTGATRLRGGSLSRPVLVFGLFLVFGYIWGAINHGDTKIGLFEARGPFMLVMLYFLVTNLVVSPRDLQRLLAILVVGTGLVALETVLRLVVVFHGHGGGPDSAFSVNHDDAVFFATTVVLCLARLALRATRRQKLICFSLLVPSLISLFVMERSAAFASFFFGLVILAATLYQHRRRLCLRVVPTVLLIVVAYAGIFWNSSGALAGPIRAWHRQSTSAGTLDQRDYESNLYRINEKADVRETFMRSPLTGIGFGRPYLDTHPLVDMTAWWPFQLYTPHIEVFWIWLKVGALGFVAFWTVLSLALQRAGWLIRRAGGSSLGFMGLVAATYIVMLLVFAYVDIGLFSERCEILLGAMIGIIAVAPGFLDGHQVLTLDSTTTASARGRAA